MDGVSHSKPDYQNPPRLSRMAAVWFTIGLTILIVLAPVWAAKPSYDAAMSFGYILQQDYAQHQAQAIIDLLDQEGMRLRVFSPFGREAVAAESTRKLWDEILFPGIVQDLKSLDLLPMLQVERILCLDNERVLECVLINPEGKFQLLLLWLDQAPNGTIRIEDYKALGRSLETIRRLRHIFLLCGAPFSAKLDEEEQDVSIRSEPDRNRIQVALQDLGRKDYDGAFQAWSRTTPELKTLRIWSEMRDTMVQAGCKSARAQLTEECQRGVATNLFLRYIFAQEAKNPAESLKALNALIDEYHQPPFLRVQKAELLASSGRCQEALALACEIYEQNPFVGGAYAAAAHAATLGRQPEAAVRALSAWANLITAPKVDKLVRDDPAFSELIRTPEYSAWLRQANDASVHATVSPH